MMCMFSVNERLKYEAKSNQTYAYVAVLSTIHTITIPIYAKITLNFLISSSPYYKLII